MATFQEFDYIFTMNKKIRYSGVLLHPTSFPSNYGIGDMGEQSRLFVDLLSDAQVGLWQILPLGPVGFGNSPYAARSAFAGNEFLISLDMLVDDGYLELSDILDIPHFSPSNVEFSQVDDFKFPLLLKAAHTFISEASAEEQKQFALFCTQQAYWLDDYALYRALVDHYNDSRWFSTWDPLLTKRDEHALSQWREKKAQEITVWSVLQYFFFQQWKALKAYANEHGVAIVGDIPIFVAADSVDAWSNRKYLKIDEDGRASALSGVPPDAFSATGQLWGNPVYDWQALERDDFSWWVQRMTHQFLLTDLVRIDHFRGFEAYWEVPAGESTAERGQWVKAPGEKLFKVLRDRFGDLPVFAEDLGVITPEVEHLRDSNGFPGMKIAHFAFAALGPAVIDPDNAYLPHNYPRQCVAYTGTHDNDTTRGWYSKLDEGMKDIVRRYLSCSDEQVVGHLMRAIMASSAQYAIVPMQDILHLGAEARMNQPGTCGNPNWTWRMSTEQMGDDTKATLKALTQPFGRNGTLADIKHSAI